MTKLYVKLYVFSTSHFEVTEPFVLGSLLGTGFTGEVTLDLKAKIKHALNLTVPSL